MSSEAITRNDLSAILNAVIHGKPSEYRKLLWENPSRTSSFAPQTISVNLDGYDEVEVWAIHNINADGSNISNIITRTKVGENATISMTRPDTFFTQDRAFQTSSSGVTFQNCVLGSSASVYNNHNVPVYIYGIKYERVAPPQVDASDYVIEQGTSGIWTYRKWDSGIAECWCRQTVTINFGQQIYSSLYTSGNTTTTTYPDIFTSIDSLICSGTDTQSTGWATLVSGQLYTNHSVVTSYMGWNSGGNQSINFSINIKGRWK